MISYSNDCLTLVEFVRSAVGLNRENLQEIPFYTAWHLEGNPFVH